MTESFPRVQKAFSHRTSQTHRRRTKSLVTPLGIMVLGLLVLHVWLGPGSTLSQQKQSSNPLSSIHHTRELSHRHQMSTTNATMDWISWMQNVGNQWTTTSSSSSSSLLTLTPPNHSSSMFEQVANLVLSKKMEAWNVRQGTEESTTNTVKEKVNPQRELRPIRQPFEIDTWSRKTSGGLLPQDRLLLAKIYGQADSVFEWGLGESSNMAAHVGVRRYGGIDSDAKYVQTARDMTTSIVQLETTPTVRNNNHIDANVLHNDISPEEREEWIGNHYHFYFADVGPTKHWGVPRYYLIKTFYNYQIAPLLAETKPFDVYLIDGRMRLECALMAFLHHSKTSQAAVGNNTSSSSSPLVLFHDFYDDFHTKNNCTKGCQNHRFRQHYQRIRQVADLTMHSGGLLAGFTRKANVTDDDIFNVWMERMKERNYL